MNDIPSIVLSGSIAVDRIMNFSGKYRDLISPDKLHVLSLSVLVDKLQDSPGGNAANIAVACAQLGNQPTLLGSVGHDARDYIQRMANQGVMTDYVHYSDLPTATFNVMTDSEGSQVGGFYPGAMHDTAARLGLERFQNENAVVVLSPHNPSMMNRQVQQCREYGLKLIYDPGQQVSDMSPDFLRAGIEAAEILILNDYEMGLLCKRLETTEQEIKTKVPIVITTLGEHGSIIEGKDIEHSIKIGSAKLDEMIDPTGAGDAYRAGFLHGYVRNWELQACGQLGSVVASFVIEEHGTQAVLSKQAIAIRYKETFGEEIEI